MKTHNNLILLAEDLAQKSEFSLSGECVRAILALDPTNITAHNLREKYRLEGNFTDAFGINACISPDDDIFRFFANHPSSTNPIRDYLSDGWRTLLELKHILEKLNRPLSECNSFLEFACGFGRFSRHLVRALPPNALHVADVAPGSIDFLKENLGVEGFYSEKLPERLSHPKKYKIIFVLSLFSHLPQSSWSSWLRKLYSFLENDGLLIFTTHGETSAVKLGVQFPPNGFVFIPSSESTTLPGEEYGSTFTSINYVRDAIATSLSHAITYEFPAQFWGSQDGFAIVKGRQA